MTGREPLRLVPPVTLVWDGAADVLQTATDARAEIDRLERQSQSRFDVWLTALAAWLVSRSRNGKAKRRNRFAVALLMAASVLIGAIFYAASAKADTADDWATLHGGAVCTTLDKYPTVERVAGILLDVMGDGLAPGQAGKAVRLSVLYGCPNYLPLLNATARRYGAAAVTHV